MSSVAMDPFTLSTGVVGILGFVMQMAKAASQAKQAVEKFKSASKEVTGLLERLVVLETVCKLVEVAVAARPRDSSGPSSASPGAMSTALLQCLRKMEALGHLLSATGLDSSQTRSPLSKSEAFSRLRFVLHRDKVKSMVQDVDHAISLLQFIINVDIWYTVKVGKTMRERSQSSRYMGFVTWTTIESWHGEHGEDHKSIPGRRGIIQVRLPLSSVKVDFHYTHFMGTPSYALNINHIIDRTSELGIKIGDLFRSDERDLLKLKKLLSNRELSLYSVVWNDANLFYGPSF
ncbi:hypothetical protein SLS53_006410 [Cytospora paraplurivora]|uniref:Fungal N-terminal domain-containing protein n=1 Tax=Cytospora paraplurivora TaxID=2898453 RepID=A0AAN9U2G2_9PEZI